MTPLDLRTAPPRPPRAEAGGLIFLPRSIDKARAALPGGNLGDYTIDGLSQWMLDTLGVERASFVSAVAAARSDEDVVAFLQEHATRTEFERWNAYVLRREPRNGNRAEALQAYPWLHAHPELTLVLDVLEEDDRQSF
jgi:hypothetical protein